MKCPHCDTQIDEHEAGRETDVCVAVVVMGWLDVKMGRDDYGGQPMPEERNEFDELLIWKPVPEYSAPDDIAAAWEVVEQMHENGTWLALHGPFGYGEEHAAYWAGFTPHLTTGWNSQPDHWTAAPSAPLAICRAALKATIHETQTA